MNFLLKIRHYFGNAMIKRHLQKQHVSKKAFDYNNVNKVGILFYLDDEKSFRQIDKFVQNMKRDHKKVRAIGFYSKDNTPYTVSESLTYDIYTKKDFSYFYKPKTTALKDFISEKFDVLIDLSTIDTFENWLVVNLSDAIYKIGKFSEEKHYPFDFMIQDEKNLSVEELTKNINYYIFNKKNL